MRLEIKNRKLIATPSPGAPSFEEGGIDWAKFYENLAALESSWNKLLAWLEEPLAPDLIPAHQEPGVSPTKLPSTNAAAAALLEEINEQIRRADQSNAPRSAEDIEDNLNSEWHFTNQLYSDFNNDIRVFELTLVQILESPEFRRDFADYDWQYQMLLLSRLSSALLRSKTGREFLQKETSKPLEELADGIPPVFHPVWFRVLSEGLDGQPPPEFSKLPALLDELDDEDPSALSAIDRASQIAASDAVLTLITNFATNVVFTETFGEFIGLACAFLTKDGRLQVPTGDLKEVVQFRKTLNDFIETQTEEFKSTRRGRLATRLTLILSGAGLSLAALNYKKQPNFDSLNSLILSSVDFAQSSTTALDATVRGSRHLKSNKLYGPWLIALSVTETFFSFVAAYRYANVGERGSAIAYSVIGMVNALGLIGVAVGGPAGIPVLFATAVVGELIGLFILLGPWKYTDQEKWARHCFFGKNWDAVDIIGDPQEIWWRWKSLVSREGSGQKIEFPNIPRQIAAGRSFRIPVVASAGYDLHLMSAATVDDVLDEGRSLVVVALVGTELRIRIFDANGEMVVNKAESELIDGAALAALKGLDPLPVESSLSPEDKRQIIENATSTAGHTPSADIHYTIYQLNHIFDDSGNKLWPILNVKMRPLIGVKEYAYLRFATIKGNGTGGLYKVLGRISELVAMNPSYVYADYGKGDMGSRDVTFLSLEIPIENTNISLHDPPEFVELEISYPPPSSDLSQFRWSNFTIPGARIVRERLANLLEE